VFNNAEVDEQAVEVIEDVLKLTGKMK
jgi:hypothetical protein